MIWPIMHQVKIHIILIEIMALKISIVTWALIGMRLKVG